MEIRDGRGPYTYSEMINIVFTLVGVYYCELFFVVLLVYK